MVLSLEGCLSPLSEAPCFHSFAQYKPGPELGAPLLNPRGESSEMEGGKGCKGQEDRHIGSVWGTNCHSVPSILMLAVDEQHLAVECHSRRGLKCLGGKGW